MSTTPIPSPTELVFIDGSLPDIDALRAGAHAGAAVYVLDPLEDGLLQMARIAAGHSGLRAIHVVSHGGAGHLQLGASTLDAHSIGSYGEALTTLGAALSAEGDLLLYGCDVAAGDLGQSFIQQLAQATGADVAASTDLTGAAFLGGDWDLEASTGRIEVDPLVVASFSGVLETPDIVATTATATVLPLQGSVTGTVGFSGDQDWYRVSLTAGTTYLFLQDRAAGSPLDSYFRLYNTAGTTLLAQDDDAGGNNNSRLSIAATATGVHFAAAGGFGSSIGNYVLRVLRVDTASTGGNDSIVGTGNNDWLSGGVGADTLDAGFGDDSLSGGDGNDSLFGGNGYDTLDGGIGADTMNGGDQDDTYYVDDANDVVSETYNDALGGVDLVIASASHTLGFGLENLTLSLSVNASAALTATGNTNNNVITGNYGDNTIDGGAGIDTLEGSYGNDVFIVDSTTDTITDISGIDRIESSVDFYLYNTTSIENLTLTGSAIYGYGNALANLIIGTASDNYLYGYEGNDTLQGGGGADTLFGADGTDSLVGGDGNDVYYVDVASDIIVEESNQGTDQVYSYALSFEIADPDIENLAVYGYDGISTYTGIGNASSNLLQGGDANNLIEGRGGEDTIYGGFGNDSLLGGTGSDTLYGDAGNDYLDGGQQADSMVGGSGDDTYVLDSYADVVVENAGEGTDTVIIGESFNLSAQVSQVENLTLTGTGHLSATGNAQANYLRGNSGNNQLDGLAGPDTMDGGAGDDTYSVDDFGDVTTESDSVSGGMDTVNATVSHALGNGIEVLSLLGDAYYGSGNASANTLYGNDAENYLVGQDGNDTLFGFDGQDELDGGAGADRMVGGDGQDFYYVDNIGDVLVELANQGDDWVYAYIDYALQTNFENLYLLSGTVGYGTDGANRMFGNSGTNVLYAFEGDDSLLGFGGNDNLYGYGGADTLDGGSGADYLWGYSGDDTYIVDNVGDTTDESDTSAAGGIDTVQSSITWTLAGGLEHLVLTGFAAITGTGNTSANQITGNSAANTLYGAAGADTLIGSNDAVSDQLYGGQNDDLYRVGTGDLILENSNEGTDTVEATVNWTLGLNLEHLVLTGGASTGTGNTLGNQITGNGNNNTLAGGDGNDTLDGGTGTDNLQGGNQDDLLIVDTTTDTIDGGAGTDTVQSSVSFSLAGALVSNVENLVLSGSGNTSATGNAAANSLTGNSGNNTLDGGGGSDTLSGGAGDDTYAVDLASDVVSESAGGGTDTVLSTASTYTLSAEVERLTLAGTGNIAGTGNAGANLLTGNSGNNTLTGGAGVDTMVGGAGNDTYDVDDAADVVTEALNEGSADTVRSTVSYTIGNHVERLTLLGTGDLTATGNSLANLLTGNDGNNLFITGGGNDTIDGGVGQLDKVRLSGNQADWNAPVVSGPQATISHKTNGQVVTILRAERLQFDNVDNVVLELGENRSDPNGAAGSVLQALGTGTGNDTLDGLGGNDTLNGFAGDDVLIGGTGFDSMVGGSGNDTYYVDSFNNGLLTSSDIVVEDPDPLVGGYDTVISTVSININNPAITGVEHLILAGSAITGGGNDADNQITGNASANSLTGLVGNDTLIGDAGNDTLAGGEGNDSLLGGDNNDSLSGDGGDDTLDGGTSAGGGDTMAGGTGDDLYRVDSSSDVVTEASGAGTDTVQSSVNVFGLVNHVENLVLVGSAVYGYGNSLTNRITGNAGNNFMWGAGAGADTMVGLEGDDYYYVDPGQTVVEADGQGADEIHVLTGGSYTLPDAVEVLSVADGAGPGVLTGNALPNMVTGNSSANTVDGAAGADLLRGLAGNDVYVVDDVADNVEETGSDNADAIWSTVTYTLSAGIELLRQLGQADIDGTGNSLANMMTGNSGANLLSGLGSVDTLIGGAGDDTLVGGAGDDLLLGGDGQDTARFSLDLQQYVLGVNAQGVITVRALSGTDGTDALVGTERAEFADGAIAVGTANQPGELPVSDTFGAGYSTTPSVAALTGGGHVIAWEEGNVVKVQRYDLLGVAQGAATQVALIGYDADVAALSDGGYAVSYFGYEADAQGYGIRVKRYDASGTETASLYLSNDSWDPQIAALSGGGFVVTWSKYDSGYDIVARIADANNTLAAPVTLSAPGGDQYYSHVAPTADGGFIATWHDASNGNILERRFDASGAPALQGGTPVPEVLVNSSYGFQPFVAVLSDGGHVTFWQAFDGYWDGVLGQRFDASGNALGDNFIVNTTIDEGQYNASAAGLADGGFVVVWESDSQDGNDAGIFGQRFSASGLKLGEEFQVNTGTLFGQRAPDVTAIGNGFLVTWRSEGDNGGVFSQRFNSAGERLGGLAITGTDAGEWLDASDAVQSVSLRGAGGDDTLIGGDAADTLEGGAGSDLLYGGGQDHLAGGAGNDVYLVSAQSDVVSELEGEGFDIVLTALADYTLAEGSIERLVLTAGGFAQATGNQDANELIGNAFANSLTGAGGDDLLQGGAGTDVARYASDIGEYVFGVDLQGAITVRHTVPGGDGTDTLRDIQGARFASPGYNILIGTLAAADTTSAVYGTFANVNDARVVALPDGGALAAWARYTPLESGYEYRVVAQRIDAAGQAIGDLITLGAVPNQGSVQNLTVTALETGVAVAWRSQYDSNPGQNQTVYTSQVRYLSSAIEPLGTGPTTVTAPVAAFPTGNMLAVELDSGALGLVYRGGYNGSFYPVETRTYTADGTLSASQTLNLGSPGDGMDVLGDGTMLVARFNSGISPQGNTEYWHTLQRYSAAGATVGGPIQLTDKSTTAMGLFDIQAVRLANGNQAVLFARYNGTDYDVAGQVFDASWNALSGTQIAFTGGTAFSQESGTIEALPTGGFVVAWVDRVGNRADVYTRVYNNNGVALSAPQLAHVTSTQGETTPNIAVHDDGSFDIFFHRDGDLIRQAYDADGRRIGGLDLSGGGLADSLRAIDAEQPTWIKGFGGNDTLTGGSANDTLDGSIGNDVLDGGAGIDSLIGGANNDTYIFDGTADIFVELEGQGTDTVLASASYTMPAGSIENVTLVGTANLSVVGNARVNVLTGNTGNNTLDGGAGNDVMAGGAGNDVYGVDAAGDIVTELAGNGIDRIRSAVSIGNLGLFAHVEELELTGSDNLYGGGNDLDNLLIGNSGTNTLVGRGGNDTYVIDVNDSVVEAANEGIDTIRIAASYTLVQPEVEHLELLEGGAFDGTGNGGANQITGNSNNNLLTGGGGNDSLIGGGGTDTLAGGLGDDTFTVDSAGDVVQESGGQGTDTVLAWVSYQLPTYVNSGGSISGEVERLSLAGTADIDATGNALPNRLTGNAGANLLDGGTGADTMAGGAGNDTYLVDVVGDVVDETQPGSGGIDTLRSLVTIAALAANIENLVLLGNDSIGGSGNELDNMLTGNDRAEDPGNTGTFTGANLLDGRAGADTMAGGTGNDIYVVDNEGDVVIELGDAGIDTVRTSLSSYTLPNNVEQLELTGTTALNATGNNQANTLTGNTLNNIIDGGAGADTMAGGKGDDFYYVESAGDQVLEIAGEGTDTVFSTLANYLLPRNVEHLTLLGTGNLNATGNFLSNILQGNDGDNALDGGQFVDVLIGAGGNDTYFVDSSDDLVVEYANGGIDTIYATVTYTLPDEVENLSLNLSATQALASAIDGTGNVLANALTGNGGNNRLSGLDGNDTLTGGAGADTLDGGTGQDAMTGNAGDDLYLVDAVGDGVVEAANEGADTVQSSLSYTLGANVENLQLLGTAHLLGTGNSLSNQLIGNDGNNQLSGLDGDDLLRGGLGVDTMIGGLGNDIYYVDNNADVVTELSGQGTDVVYVSSPGTGLNQAPLNGYALPANVENVVYFDPNLLFVVGNGLNNYFTGNDGNNTLDGAGGADTMEGGGGNDTYKVDNAGDTVVERGSEGVDVVEASVSYALSENVENLVLTGSAQQGTGNSSHNAMTGNAANNLLDGGSGNDTMAGGAGNDTYKVDANGDVVTEGSGSGTDMIVALVDLTLPSQVENLELDGLNNLTGTGNELDNTLIGNNGNNVINGGAGRDTASYGKANGGVNVNLGTGQATGGGGTDILNDIEGVEGSAFGDSLTGSAGDNTLNGAAGRDTMVGGFGNDTYYVDDPLDQVVEVNNNAAPGAPAGVDLNVNLDTVVASTVSYTLGAYLENLVQAGVSNATGNGNELANVLTGNDGNNLLNGMAGNDTINGGLGNDTVIGGQGNDSLVGGTGTDTADYSASTGGVTVELWRGLTSADGLGGQDTVLGFEVVIGTAQNDLIAGSSIGDSLTGGAGNDGLYGGDGNDTLVAGLGQDTMDGGSGIDTVDYSAAAGPVTAELWRAAALNDGQGAIDTLAGIEVLIGSTFNDILAGAGIGESFVGGAGNDGIYAGGGNDTLVGGLGNDTLDGGTNIDLADYSAAATGVVVSLLAAMATNDGDGGQDAVWNIESVIGSAFNDQLIGGLGADTLTGGAGNDTLSGGAGNDRLDGTSGIDTVTYAAATAGVTAELWRGMALVDGQGGIDTLLNIDNLTGSNQNDLLAGTDLDNLLQGGSGNDSLYAAGGADTLVGGAGNDILDGGSGTDVADYSAAAGPVTAELWRGATLADGSGGTDTFFNIENLIGSAQNDLLAGTDLANALTGGAGNDQLFGAGGADTLAGGLGNDTLNGGAGADLFLFNAAFGAGNIDTVQDFSVVDDTVALENAIFTALLNPGALAASQLRAGAGITTAADADDFVLYNSSTGALLYDPDGNGAVVATQIATLGVGLALTAADFSVV